MRDGGEFGFGLRRSWVGRSDDVRCLLSLMVRRRRRLLARRMMMFGAVAAGRGRGRGRNGFVRGCKKMVKD